MFLRRSLTLIGAALTLLIALSPVHALQTPTGTPTPVPSPTPTLSTAVLLVTKLDDTNDGVCDADCSLREAVAVAPWGGTIKFAPGVTGIIYLKSSIVFTDRYISIVGPGPKSSSLIINGSKVTTSNTALLEVSPTSTLMLDTLTIASGTSLLENLGGFVSIKRCTITLSVSTFGAIINFNGNLVIDSSTITNNKTRGLYNISSGLSQVTNSTFYKNIGPAIYNEASMSIQSSTFLGNFNQLGHDIFTGGHGRTVARNSIFASQGDNRGNCGGGGIIDAKGNLQYPLLYATASCGPTIPVGDPKLGLLKDNGGPTDTLELLPGSAGIAMGDINNCNSLGGSLDQRGFRRASSVVGGGCDVGAFEYSSRN